MDGCRDKTYCCCAPRWILSQLLSCLKRIIGDNHKSKEGSERLTVNPDSAHRVLDHDASADYQESYPTLLETNQTGRSTRGTSPNVAVGCFLLNLIVESKNELSKIAEMRMQMEKLLQELREERKQHVVVTIASDEQATSVYTDADVVEGASFEMQLSHPTSDVLPKSSITTVCADFPQCETPKREDCIRGMDQLEAELEAELELLQFHVDTDAILKDSQNCSQVTVEDTSPNSQITTDDNIDPFEEPKEVSHGISPYKLERKLHEVIEARHEEQIRELEAEIEAFKQKLLDKELEFSWWKDKARITSENLPEYSGFTLRHDSEAQ